MGYVLRGHQELDATERLSTDQEKFKNWLFPPVCFLLTVSDIHTKKGVGMPLSLSLSVCAELSHTIFSIKQEPNNCLDFK